ncbi:hypothetical protein WMY93_007427 [Mugilogobius chulae]|uniref:Uncharacterized protein n=1 Tax=Mugilogobius chulae TaxID=88201 RepID=A0AAW0PP41_9GOBI
MSQKQNLRALVTARLTAAAEEIFALFETTIAAKEKELRRSKLENQRKQEQLDSILKALSPTVVLTTTGVQLPSLSPASDLDQKIPAASQIKEEPEEQSVKQEEEEPQVCVDESSSVCVKVEELFLLEQTQADPKEEQTQRNTSAQSHIASSRMRETQRTLLTMTMMKTGALHSQVQLHRWRRRLMETTATKSRSKTQAQLHKTQAYRRNLKQKQIGI